MLNSYFKFLVLLILFTGINLHAQEFKYGIEIGSVLTGTMSDFPNSVEKAVLPPVSYSINGYVEYKENETWGLSIDPGIILKAKVTPNQHPLLVEKVYYVQYDYLNMPLTVNFYFNNRFSVSCGPQFAYILDGKGDATPSDNAINITNTKKTNFETTMLIGLNLSIIKNIDFCLRYNRGFTYVQKRYYLTDESQPASIGYVNNQHLQFLLRVLI
jgi:hypothetical protein